MSHFSTTTPGTRFNRPSSTSTSTSSGGGIFTSSGEKIGSSEGSFIVTDTPSGQVLVPFTTAPKTSGGTTTTTTSGGGGSFSRSTFQSTPTETTTISRFIPSRGGGGAAQPSREEVFFTRQPTAEEQVRMQSLPQPETKVGRLQTREGFERGAFFQDILTQQREFESLTPEQARGRALSGDPRFVGMSTPEGEVITFTPSITRAEVVGEQAFKELPKGEQRKLILTERAIGAGKVGLSAATFLPDVGFTLIGGTIREGEQFKPFSFGGEFGKTEKALENKFKSIREFKEIPTGEEARKAQIVTTGGLILLGGFGAAKQFTGLRAAGLTRGQAALETAGILSPLRPQAKVFVRPIGQEEPFQFISTLEQKPGGIKVRQIKGVGEDFIFDSKQAFRTLPSGEVAAGGIETTISQRGFFVGAGKVREGIVISGTKDVGVKTGKPGEAFLVRDIRADPDRLRLLKNIDAAAGVSKIGTIQQPTFSIFLEGEVPGTITGFGTIGGRPFGSIRRIGGISKEIEPGISEIILGRARPTLTKEGIKFRIKPTARGFEFDITKPSEVTDVIVLRGTGKKTPFDTTFGQQAQSQVQTQKQITNIRDTQVKSVQDVAAQRITPDVIQTQRVESAFAGTGLYERTTGGLLPGEGRLVLVEPQEQILRFKEQPSLILEAPSQQELIKERNGIIPRLRQPLKVAQDVAQKQIAIPRQIEITKLVPEEPAVPRIPFPFRPFFPRPRIIPPIPPVRLFGTGFREPQGAFPPFRYQPSITGLTLGLKGRPAEFIGGGLDPFTIRGIGTKTIRTRLDKAPRKIKRRKKR